MMNKKQIRQIELRNFVATSNGEDMCISGLASVYDIPTVLWKHDGIEYKEVIKRGAFDDADLSDCCLKYNHSDNIPILARVKGGSLVPKADNIGLKFDATLFNTSIARDVYTLIKEKCLDKCSFAFTVKEDDYDNSTHTRTIIKIDKVYDISIVDLPAYNATEVSARNYFETQNERLKQFNQDQNVKRALLKLKLTEEI